MAILDDADKATLHAFILVNPNLTDAQVFDLMYAPTAVPNPTPMVPLPAPYGATTLTLAVDPSRRSGIVPFLGDLAPLIAAQNTQGIAQWGAELLLLGFLQQADIDAITTILTATVPDPAYQATVDGPSWAATHLGCFGDRTWTNPETGSTHDFVPIEAIPEAR